MKLVDLLHEHERLSFFKDKLDLRQKEYLK